MKGHYAFLSILLQIHLKIPGIMPGNIPRNIPRNILKNSNLRTRCGIEFRLTARAEFEEGYKNLERGAYNPFSSTHAVLAQSLRWPDLIRRMLFFSSSLTSNHLKWDRLRIPAGRAAGRSPEEGEARRPVHLLCLPYSHHPRTHSLSPSHHPLPTLYARQAQHGPRSVGL